MLEKINKLYIGIIAGIVFPVIFYFVFYHHKIPLQNIPSLRNFYLELILASLPAFLSKCIFPNALIFFLLTWKNLLLAAKGVLISTAILATMLVVMNFIF